MIELKEEIIKQDQCHSQVQKEILKNHYWMPHSSTIEKAELSITGTSFSHRFTRQQKEVRWTIQEQMLYTRFVRINLTRLSKSKFSKRYNKFQKMSEFILSKNISQCRRHHQTMLKKYGPLQQMLQVEGIPRRPESLSSQKADSEQISLNLPVIIQNQRVQSVKDQILLLVDEYEPNRSVKEKSLSIQENNTSISDYEAYFDSALFK